MKPLTMNARRQTHARNADSVETRLFLAAALVAKVVDFRLRRSTRE